MTRGRLAVLVPAVVAGALSLWPGVPALAFDDPRDALRPCTRADLIGTWAMIRLGTAPSVRVDATDPYFYPYQRYAFSADRRMRHLTAQAPVGPEEQRTILSAPATITWSVDDRGRLLTRKTGAAASEVDACQILLAKISDPRSSVPGLPGDVLLTHYGEDGKPVARRLLRKMSGPSE
ncbi:MAG: hypothetical protein DMD87_00875 [Candidatus Rokuibacteriota bacterium]|nr:MAG: hypothetical protein DMD87_00875 [Candidatus Rokubacteria bacterium]